MKDCNSIESGRKDFGRPRIAGSRRAFHGGQKFLLHVALLAGVLLHVPAQAVNADEATRLLKAGKHAEAMQIIEDGLKRDPKDIQLRFAKGVALAERKRPQEAIAVFQKLSEDHPDLPEPYNNLAVLYGREGQIEKARTALNMAIKANPSVATAYENLGDVHARIAAQSYGKALNMHGQNAGPEPKLRLLSALVLPKPTVVSVPAVPDIPKPNAEPATPAVTIAKAPEPKPLPQASRSRKEEQAPVAAAASQQGTVAVSPTPSKPAASTASEQDEVIDAVEAWKTAWETKDMQGYVAAYDNGFYSGGTKNHAQWVRLRKTRILNKDSIKITIEKPTVRLNGNTAVASFRQVYAGGNVHSDGMKTLTLQKKSGKWKITEEVSTD